MMILIIFYFILNCTALRSATQDFYVFSYLGAQLYHLLDAQYTKVVAVLSSSLTRFHRLLTPPDPRPHILCFDLMTYISDLSYILTISYWACRHLLCQILQILLFCLSLCFRSDFILIRKEVLTNFINLYQQPRRAQVVSTKLATISCRKHGSCQILAFGQTISKIILVYKTPADNLIEI